ncbi:retrotransposon-related protein [Tanacetum coccineum]|uniref:Retrotransposon-related protein n=1 Tax=Tanacetum coccineum TaxID=301880 RepID=A0ABQ5A3M2_9ASTR
MSEEDIPKTFGLMVMPFGLTNAPSTFQSLMNQVEYLGHIISDLGVATDPTKIGAMMDWPTPSNIKQLRGFMGLTGYYRSCLSAYLSKTLAPKHHSLSAYEKELLAVIMALDRWRGYLLDRHFQIKTDHFSLKYFLDQRITTPFQSKWLPKLLGYDYEILYKKGKENQAADALSRTAHGGELSTMVVSTIFSGLMEEVHKSCEEDNHLQKIVKKIEEGKADLSKYSWSVGQLRRKGKLMVGANDEIRRKLVDHFHSSAEGGHSGVVATTQRLKNWFYWKGMRKTVKQRVSQCDICHRNKADLAAYPGLLQPLPIPHKIWVDISMDFIDGLPMSNGKTVIMVIVDRLSKYAHFIPMSHPYSATQVAQVFLDNVYKLHGLPKTIISDRDKVFTSLFWKSLFKILKVELKMSSAYHPQTDGQTEAVNKTLECYLRCMTGETPKEWTKWLPLAEFWYNTKFHTSANTTPFEIVYGQTPPQYVTYEVGECNVEAVDRTLVARDQAIKLLQFYLQRAQDRMKTMADKKRSDREFAEGEWVYLKLQPYRQLSVRQSVQHKLSAKYHGPFKVLKKVGSVAYKLELPASAQVHDVFHVSQLKKCKNKETVMGSFPQCGTDGLIAVTPIAVLDRRMVKKRNRVAVDLLIQWANHVAEDATWEPYEEIQKRFPDFAIDP